MGAGPGRQRREPDATLVATLLLVAQLAVPAAVGNRALARRLWEAAQEREAVLDLGGALALYRAARAADPSYLPSQYDYFELMRASGLVRQLRRELARPDPRGGPLTLCLAQVTRLRRDDVSGGRRLGALLGGGGDSCPFDLGVLFLGKWVFNMGLEPRFLASGATLVRDAPESWRLWEFYCNGLVRAGRTRDAPAVLRRAIALTTNGFAKANLYDKLRSYDGVGSREVQAIAAALARDARPGVGVLSLFDDKGNWDEHARLARARGVWWLEWQAFTELGKRKIERSDPAAALIDLDRAVLIADSVGRPPLQIVSYMTRGRANAKLGKLQAAEHDLLHAIALGPEAEEPYYLYQSWHNLAHVYESAGRFREAAHAVDQFVWLTRDLTPDWDDHWMSLHDAGTIRWKAGWHAAARADFDSMVQTIDQQHRETGRCNGFYFAGEYYERSGDLQRALAYYRAGACERDIPSIDGQDLAGLVRVYEQLDEPDSAEAVARFHDSAPERWQATEVPLLPEVLASRGRVADAVRVAQAWAERQARGGHVQATALAKLELADLLLREGRPQATLGEATAVDSLARSLTLTDERIRAGTLRGRALFALGDHEGGLRALHAAAALAAAHPTAEGVLATQLALGDALAATSRPQAALAAYDRAALTVERITIGLRGDVDRAGYRERHLRPFDGALRVLLGASDPPRAALDAAVLWAERRKAAALALATTDAARPPAPLDRAALQRRLDPREALVDYIVTDSLVAAVVLTDRSAAVVRLPITQDSARLLVERLRRPLVTTFAGRLDLSRAPYDLALAHALYAALVGPLEPALAGRDRWFIIPDGPLYALSFEALVTSAPAESPDYAAASYLLDRVQVSYLPAAQFLSPPADRGGTLAGARVLAVAGNAPGSAREVAAIRGAFSPARVRVLSLDTATETAVRAAAGPYAIIHLATHAEVNNSDPLASHLRLARDGANDGYLHGNEITMTRWRARLVVLSACETIGGRLYEGEGLMGLARAFLAGGAKAVAATQWPVGAASADMMDTFYRELAAGSTPDAALRDAQMALRRAPATSHPFYWGGFVLVRGR